MFSTATNKYLGSNWVILNIIVYISLPVKVVSLTNIEKDRGFLNPETCRNFRNEF